MCAGQARSHPADIAQLGYAHWFFGNLYEAVVRVPDRLAKVNESGVDDRRLASVLSPGSPVWYYVRGVPVVIGATLAALFVGWTSRNDRPWLGAAAVGMLSGVVATVYLVRAVNVQTRRRRPAPHPSRPGPTPKGLVSSKRPPASDCG